MADPPTFASASLGELTSAALGGSHDAWRMLVEKLQRVVWKAVNMMTTDEDVRNDAFSATWLRLVERLDTIREPEKLPGWLATTATNEVHQILRQRDRRHLHLDWSAPGDVFGELLDPALSTTGDHERGLVLAETRRAIRQAFALLDEECRRLLTVLVLEDPQPSYQQASKALGRPVGALGPSRRRCLEKLKSLGRFADPVGDHG